MLRRKFAKLLTIPVFGWVALKTSSCGAVGAVSALSNDEDSDLPETIRIWSYYVPLTSYDGVIEDFEGRDPLDVKIIFDEVRARTSRISGNRNDGTANRESLNVVELRESEEDYTRVRFWHDDNDSDGDYGHTLYLFKRYLDALEAGEKVFVATGITQGHFHVVMLDPNDA